ncbi:MAG: hypothetical protein Crog4KO_21280 [Crocinitomicaceae bacterium]
MRLRLTMRLKNRSVGCVKRAGSFACVLVMGTLFFSCSDSNSQKISEDPVRKENTNTESEEELVPEEKIGADLTDSEKVQLLADFQSGKRNFDFYASFTEPFWTFYFVGNQVMFVSMDSEVPDVVPLEYPFTDQEESQVLRFLLNSTLWELEVIKEEGSDGMSDLSYPYSVKCGIYEGGGGTNYVKENE